MISNFAHVCVAFSQFGWNERQKEFFSVWYRVSVSSMYTGVYSTHSMYASIMLQLYSICTEFCVSFLLFYPKINEPIRVLKNLKPNLRRLYIGLYLK